MWICYLKVIHLSPAPLMVLDMRVCEASEASGYEDLGVGEEYEEIFQQLTLDGAWA